MVGQELEGEEAQEGAEDELVLFGEGQKGDLGLPASLAPFARAITS